MNIVRILFLMTLLSASISVVAQDADEAPADDAAELAKKLNNPVASLISVPIEYNLDSKIGPSETGETWTVKFTPVVPFELNDNWNLITRTIFSYVDTDIPDYGVNETGISDIVEVMYFSPKAPTASGIIWGAGPLILMDTATDDAIGAGKWGTGPAGVILKQQGQWSVGMLAHYLTDIGGGGSDRTDVEQLFFQPFLSYNITPQLSWTAQTEYTRNLENNTSNGYFIFSVNKTMRVGKQLLQGRVGVRHWYEQAEFGPDSTELMLRLTLLYPK